MTNKVEKQSYPQRVLIRGVVYRVYEDRAIVMGRSGPRVEIAIQSTVRGKSVTAINRNAFKNDHDLLSVVFPKSIETIGSHSFENCIKLTALELPTNLLKVNWYAFAGCTSLTTVHLPFRLERIGHHAFAGCTSLLEVPHFVQTGPKSQAKLSRKLVEQSLPVSLKHLGEAVFEGCTSLTKIVVPYRIREIPENLFNGCSSLNTVWLHNRIRAIKTGSFRGCDSLVTLRIPDSVVNIGVEAWSATTQIVSEEGSAAIEYAVENGLPFTRTELPLVIPTSQFGAPDLEVFEEVVSDERIMSELVQYYELRPSSEEFDRNGYSPQIGNVPLPRFTYENGTYLQNEPVGADDDVVIALVGDIMCGARSQRMDQVGTTYSFDRQFENVSAILSQTDLAIGNLETMVSERAPFASEMVYIEDRPNLNAPIEFLGSVRRAGFDVVTSAQNHMYDTGVRGIFDTLDALNHANLIHGGMFASTNDPRVLMFEIKGMKIAIVSYLDPVRQRMKKAALTNTGLTSLVSLFEEEQIKSDIMSARDQGAEFIIACAHWGVEYTDRISERQAQFAQSLADSGVDFIFGSHSHCPQPFASIEAADSRQVPVVYSGGNFISDIARHAPITQDAVLGLLKLTRDSDGNIRIKGNGYIPCRIVQPVVASTYSVVPCEILADGIYGYTREGAVADTQRIRNVLGESYKPILVNSVRQLELDSSVYSPISEKTSGSLDEIVRECNDYGFNPLVRLDKNSLESALMEVQALGFGLETTRYSTQVFTAVDTEGNTIGFKRVASNLTSMIGLEFCADKILCKTILLENGLPTAYGLPMPRNGHTAAKKFVAAHGWPVVVKPRRGSGGRAVTANIQNDEQLRTAVNHANEFGGFLIEKHVPGEDYRFLVSGNEVLGVWCRDAASVVGDGISTIDSLIDAKNRIRETNPHLASRLIKKDTALIEHLRWAGLTLNHVPQTGKKVYLRSAANLSAGGDNIDVTDETHDSLKEIAVRAKNALPGIELVGIDLLIESHSVPASEQVVNICEINSTPGVSAHEYPMFGNPQPAAKNYVEHIALSSAVNLKEYRENGNFEMRISGSFNEEKFSESMKQWAQDAGVEIQELDQNASEARLSLKGSTVAAAFMNYSALRGISAGTSVSSSTLKAL